jgi:intracellular multiplication protein IcmO
MGLSFSTLRRLQLGGIRDATSLLSIAAGGWATHPGLAPFGFTASAAAGVGLGALGGAMLGKRFNAEVGFDTLLGGELRINSSAPPPRTEDGMLLGYIVDTGEPLYIPMDEWVRHGMIAGQSGVGKTVSASWIEYQQIQRGGGLLMIDGKLDPDNLDLLRDMAASAGRLDDLLVISPGDPANSNSYNPILFGDPDEVASRCMSLIPATESDAGADHYRQSANTALTTLFNAIQACGLAYSFADLYVLLTNAEAMNWLEKRVPYGSEAQKQLSLFIHNYKRPSKGPGGGNGQELIDPSKLKDTLGGIGGRLFQFGTGKFGQVLNTYSPEVRLKEAILANKIIYIALPTMGKAEAASSFGKMAIGDLRTAIAQIQALPKHMRPRIPFLCFYDECGSYVTQAWSRMFEQARSARMMMLPAFQTKANLEVLGEELRAMVSGNTLTKLFFKPGEPETAEWMSEMIGKEFRTTHTITANRGEGASKAAHMSSKPAGWTDSGATAFSETTELEYKITGTELMMLGKGEAIVNYDGSKIYHIRVPHVRFENERELGSPINRSRPKFVKGLDFMKNVDRWTGKDRGIEL